MIDPHAGQELIFPHVQRIRDSDGTRVEPAINEAWTEQRKLAWHAAVCAKDTGLRIRLFSYWDGYNLVIEGMAGCSSVPSLSYMSAWDYLNGVRLGVEAIRNQDRSIA